MSESMFRYDFYRYYGGAKRSLLKRLLLPHPLELQYIRSYRKAQYYKRRKFFFFLYLYWELKRRRLSAKTHIQIPTDTKIGKGFFINHFGRIIVNPRAVLGKNITICTGVTIGQTNRGKKQGVPTISDKVWIGANSMIVGNIKIGTDVLIAPNSYVNFDVPSHSIVIGNPAKIISREDATAGYIDRMVD